MFQSYIFDIVICLVLVYMLLGMLLSCVQEVVASIQKSRGKLLNWAINEVLNDPFNKNFASLLYVHPSVDYFKKNQKDLPSYIDDTSFSKALIGIIQQEGTKVYFEQDPLTLQRREIIQANPDCYNRFLDGIHSLQHSDLKKLLFSFTQDINQGGSTPSLSLNTNMDLLTRKISEWYNNYMDRVTGWYKRIIKRQLIFYATILTLFLNINFIAITHSIYIDNQLRNRLLPIAGQLAKKDSLPTLSQQGSIQKNIQTIDSVKNVLSSVGIPIGWNLQENQTASHNIFNTIWNFFGQAWATIYSSGIGYTIWGWIFSIIILSFGAPFWFDVLKKLINIRNTGIKPEANPKSS